jgi:hypothetical protein
MFSTTCRGAWGRARVLAVELIEGDGGAVAARIAE